MERQLQYVSFRYFLQETFLRFCRKNTAYSVRAFAKRLRIHPTTLSQILSGKRKITARTYVRLADRLEIPASQRAWFERTFQRRSAAKAPLSARSDIRRLSGNEAEALVGWQHLAILELAKTVGFVPSPPAIAERLGIPEKLAQESVDRLLEFGRLAVDSEGNWIPAEENTVNIPSVSNEVIKRAMRENIELAGERYEAAPFREGFGTYIVFPVLRERIEVAIEALNAATVRMVDEIDDGGPYDEVYCLTTVLFPMSRSG